MLIVLLVICLLTFGLGFYLQNSPKFEHNDDCDMLGFTLSLVGGLLAMIVVIIILVMMEKVVSLSTVDSKISLYELANQEIEDEFDAIVGNYMSYEMEFNAKLKSDAMVQQQLELYRDNKSKILALNEDKINGRITRWWLYFGK